MGSPSVSEQLAFAREGLNGLFGPPDRCAPELCRILSSSGESFSGSLVPDSDVAVLLLFCGQNRSVRHRFQLGCRFLLPMTGATSVSRRRERPCRPPSRFGLNALTTPLRRG